MRKILCAIAFIWAAIGMAAQTPIEYGLVSISVATLRAEPRQGAELETQAMMGTPLRLYDNKGEWWLATTPDGYKAWINESAFTPQTESEMRRWRSAARQIATAFDQFYIVDPETNIRVTDVVNGCILELDTVVAPAGFKALRLPDGRRGVAPADMTVDFAAWASDTVPDIARLLSFAESMTGIPYLWGGMSTKMIDCSGFSKLLYQDAAHIILPRNASQQALVGLLIETSGLCKGNYDELLNPGDLLMFSNPDTGRINHVGVYQGDGMFIHSSGRVYCSSLDPSSPDATQKTLSHAVRMFDPATGLPYSGLVKFKDHPDYFE